MTVTISRLYETYGAAERVVRDLESAGLSHKDISIVANNADGWYKDGNGLSRADKDRGHDAGNDRPRIAAKGAGIGAAVGGAAGLLTGLGLLRYPVSARRCGRVAGDDGSGHGCRGTTGA